MRAIAVIFVVISVMTPAWADTNWPDWRGPTADGHADAAALPLHWSETEKMEGRYSTALLMAGDRIYLSNKKGRTTIIQVAAEDHELATNEIDGELWASPAVSGNSLILRTKTHLYRIQAP